MSETSVLVSSLCWGSLLGAFLASSRPPPHRPYSVPCVLFPGGQPPGQWCPGDLGAAPVRGRAQRAGLRAEATGGGAGA